MNLSNSKSNNETHTNDMKNKIIPYSDFTCSSIKSRTVDDSAILLAVKNNDMAELDILLAEIKDTYNFTDVISQGLWIAAESGYIDVVNILFEYEADINYRFGKV